jgi:lysophospholipase L1-like esterase
MDNWITVWNQSHTNIKTVTPQYRNRTMWLTVPMSLSGDRIRVRFSNKEGCTNLHICQASVWLDGGRRQALRFQGEESLLLDIGEEQYSDEIRISVSAGRLLSLAVAFEGHPTSGNCIAAHVQCSRTGNCVYEPQMDISRRNFVDSYWGNLPGIPAVSAIEVRTEAQPDVIVCFGDSITQQSTWTIPLERMLNERGHKTVVLNAGIGGNRLLLGPPEPALQVFGPAAVNRFERDVLGVPGATSVLLALGTNDIGWIRKPEDIVTAGANPVFAGLKELADLAHQHNLLVFAATLTPRMGSMDYSPEQEAERIQLNSLIRQADCFDKVIDFAAAIADVKDTGIMAPHCDSGDHLHPSALGGYQMAAHACEVILQAL